MTVKIIFPPRPKGKMLHTDLPQYESNGNWLAQRKFNGSRCVVHISKDKYVMIGNRHGGEFASFKFTIDMIDELLSSLKLENDKSYWLDGELMNKQKDATNEIIFFDVLQAGRYMFGNPCQVDRLEILRDICKDPTKKSQSGLGFQISNRFTLAEVFNHNFKNRFDESLEDNRLEGLVLRKKSGFIDDFGSKEYVTTNLIRCRKPFGNGKSYNY